MSDSKEAIIPLHYQNGGKDLLDHLEEILPEDEMRGAYRFNVIKYADRAGKKDNIDSELGKIIEYTKRWEKWEDKIKEDKMRNLSVGMSIDAEKVDKELSETMKELSDILNIKEEKTTC